MLLFFVQTVLLVATGVLLWRLWKSTAAHSFLAGAIVGAGIILRAVPGVSLFFVSWFEMPFGRSLQLGRGFWFFSTDGIGYFDRAIEAIQHGPSGILQMSRTYPSVFYNQVLATFTWLLGPIASVGLLLNVLCFLVLALLIVRWAARYRIGPVGVAVPLLAVSLSPSWILWSVQPLKDPFFCMIIILFAFAVDLWVHAWRAKERRVPHALGAAVLLVVTMYAIAGVRWYYACVALAAAALPLLSVLFTRMTAKQRFGAAFAVAALMYVMAQQIIFGAGPYLPESIKPILRGARASAAPAVTAVLEDSRRNLDTFKDSSTRIRTGETLRRIEEEAEQKREEKPAQVAVASRPRRKPRPEPAQTASAPDVTTTQSPDAGAPPQTAHATPALTAAQTPASDPAAKAAAKPAQVASADAPPASAEPKSAPKTTPAPEPAKEPKPATASQKPAVTSQKPAVTSQKPAVTSQKPAVTSQKPATAVAEAPRPAETRPAPPQTTTPAPVAVAEQPKPAPAIAPATAELLSEEQKTPVSDVPTTPKARLIAGFTALLLPHFVGESLGLISLGGGRGFWWFADLDTLLFNALLLVSLVVFIRRRRVWRDPFAWYVIVVGCVMAGALAYTISNYGALFRHRSMVLSAIVLLPLVAYRARRNREDGSVVEAHEESAEAHDGARPPLVSSVRT